MEKNRNPFRKLSEDELKQAEKKARDLEKIRKETEALAVKCINHEDFAKYRETYVLLERTTIDALIDYADSEPMSYAFGVRRMIDELRQLRLLLKQVEIDNRVRVKK